MIPGRSPPSLEVITPAAAAVGQTKHSIAHSSSTFAPASRTSAVSTAMDTKSAV